MRYIISILLFVISVNTYSQERISFIDSLRTRKDEIAKLEKYNNRIIKNNPVLREYPNIKQFHFFVLQQNDAKERITLDEYSDYSFLRKLHFRRVKYKTSWFCKKSFIRTETFLFTTEGKPIGIILRGKLEPLDWLVLYNLKELGMLVVDDKISFGFCSGRLDHEIFGYSRGEFHCVIHDKIYHLENLEPYLEDKEFHLIPFEDYVKKYKKNISSPNSPQDTPH